MYLRKKFQGFWSLNFGIAIRSRNFIANIYWDALSDLLSWDKHHIEVCNKKMIFNKGIACTRVNEGWVRENRSVRALAVKKTSFRLKVIKISHCFRYAVASALDFYVIYTAVDSFFFVCLLFRPTIDRLRNFLAALPTEGLYRPA